MKKKKIFIVLLYKKWQSLNLWIANSNIFLLNEHFSENSVRENRENCTFVEVYSNLRINYLLKIFLNILLRIFQVLTGGFQRRIICLYPRRNSSFSLKNFARLISDSCALLSSSYILETLLITFEKFIINKT